MELKDILYILKNYERLLEALQEARKDFLKLMTNTKKRLYSLSVEEILDEDNVDLYVISLELQTIKCFLKLIEIRIEDINIVRECLHSLPTKWWWTVRYLICESLPSSWVCEYVGVSRSTIFRYKKRAFILLQKEVGKGQRRSRVRSSLLSKSIRGTRYEY